MGEYLHWAEWVYNTNTHKSTALSPFSVVNGKPPPSNPHYATGSSPIEVVDDTLSYKEQLIIKLKDKLARTQATMKHQVYLHRVPHTFKQGDLVLVKLRPYRQHSAASHRVQKLAQC